MGVRRQLSLFIPSAQRWEIEAVRAILDPVQRRLIPAHVTLCRDEETERLLDGPEPLEDRDAGFGPLEMQFGQAEPFYDHGILLPCEAGRDAFQKLRNQLLGGTEARKQDPHITLAHPRNPKSAGNTLSRALELPSPLNIKFTELNLIEQTGGDPWRVVGVFAL